MGGDFIDLAHQIADEAEHVRSRVAYDASARQFAIETSYERRIWAAVAVDMLRTSEKGDVSDLAGPDDLARKLMHGRSSRQAQPKISTIEAALVSIEKDTLRRNQRTGTIS